MTRHLLTATAATFALALTAGSGSAQEATTFDFGVDPATGEAAYADFNASFDESGLYDAWDADQDEMLSREEFDQGLFSVYDADRDAMLSDEEVAGMGEDRLFSDATVTAGGAPTATQKGTINDVNFTGIYDTWDADKDEMLSREEFNQGVFNLGDADRDQVLSSEEVADLGDEGLFHDATVKAGGAPTETQAGSTD